MTAGLVELDPADDAALRELLKLHNASMAVDLPWEPPKLLSQLTAGIRYSWDGEPARRWLCRDGDGRLIGQLSVFLPERDNQHAAGIGILVHPEHRRAGHGRRMYDAGRAVAAEAGRRLLLGGTLDSPGPNAFAALLGFSRASVQVHRRQDLTEVDLGQVAVLRERAAAAASDYRLLRIVGPVPDELLAAYVVMFAAINDAPTDDLDIEHMEFDSERIRRFERSQAAQAVTPHQLVAQRISDGTLAGHTVVGVSAERPEWAGQGNTSVLVEHRGHRLGLLLKASMIEWLRSDVPDVRYLDTGNAESNHHMIRINEQLGYRVVARYLNWQQHLS